MALPGFDTAIQITGTSTAMVAEATTALGSDRHQITDTAKRVLDPDTAVVIDETGSPIAASLIVDIDFLFGIVEVDSSVVGTVTIDANYLPLHTIAEAYSHSLSDSAEVLDCTVYSVGTARHPRSKLHGVEMTEMTVDVLALTSDQAESYNPTEATPSGTFSATAVANGSTIIFTGPTGGPITITQAAATDYAAFEVSTAEDLVTLINNEVPGLTAVWTTVVTLTVTEEGVGPNSWTVTGTGSWTSVNTITFSGGTKSLSWDTLKANGGNFIVSLQHGSSPDYDFRGWFFIAERNKSGSVEGRIENDVKLIGTQLSTQNAGFHASFGEQ